MNLVTLDRNAVEKDRPSFLPSCWTNSKSVEKSKPCVEGLAKNWLGRPWFCERNHKAKKIAERGNGAAFTCDCNIKGGAIQMRADIGKDPNKIGFVAIVLASTSLPLAMLTLPLTVAVPAHFGDALGLNLTLIGTIFMAVRVLDIFIDPALGMLMDGTVTRFGRFRPWLLGGAPFVIGGTAMLFMAQPGVGPLYLVVGLILAYLGWSIMSLAQLALAAGLGRGNAARAKVYAWVQAFFFLGICLVLLLPLLLHASNSTASLQVMGWLIIAVTIPVTLIVCALVPENVVKENMAKVEHQHVGVVAYLKLVARPAVVRLLAIDVLFGLGFGIASAVLFFFFVAIKGLDRSAIGLAIIAQMSGGMVAVPLIARAAARYGKHVMLVVCGLGTALICPTIILVPHGSVTWAVIDYFLWGVFYGGVAFLPRAMMADVGDEVRLESRRDRSGVLLALLISSWKLGGAFSVGIGFIALDYIGYQAKLGAANTPASIDGLQFLFAGTPAVLGLIAAIVAWGYPLTKKRHAVIRDALDARERGPALAGLQLPLGAGQATPAE
jgi:Na+/melibiose symporter-like transporter